MAGEIEEPIKHDFQAGSISISNWERRSSFSHNRYLEEVEKCSKPGSVTEKKAYFEAHFRKKGILPLSSPSEIKYQTSENDISEKTGYDKEINHINAVYGTSASETRFELSCDVTDNTDYISHHSKLGSFSEIEVRENLDGEESNVDTSHVSNVTIGPSNDDHTSAKSQRGSSSKEKIQSQVEYTKPKSALQVSVAQSRRYINKSSKGSEEKTKKTVNNFLMRSKIENKTSKASAQEKRPMHKIPKNECGSKAKGDNDIKRSEKISRNRRMEEPRSSTLRKVSSGVHQRENRINSAVGMTQPCIKQDNSRFSFKCNARAERRKEEKTEAELKQLRKSLNLKAKPLPSFYRGALRDSDRNKAPANNVKPGKIRTNSVSNGTRVSESSQLSCISGKDEAVFISGPPKTNDHVPQASGATSGHSTVTSDSSPSSPSAVISNSQPCQKAIINSTLVGRKK